ncbi:hypothetical protein D8X55_00460 [Malacoplasma penetrans]|uniref:Uncharacterized protein n=1 Tax=Malacoplasma penetrans (strain HF-2) TaxID=272633 RepID=Q8EX22_MALP2|nr:leucine-rich repeat protein [Malacoplasma penetrans]RXY97389.1 hypothetical protein D8X55_00460 [Malacoplasma penetrans]BAC43818.1 hypothetical protein [Malacoplasma penetrans HF-2]
MDQKNQTKLNLLKLKEELTNLKWSENHKYDDFNHISSAKALELLEDSEYFYKDTKTLDLWDTHYEVIDEFAFHSKGIEKVILPKRIVVIAKYSFANNMIKELDLTNYKNLEVIEDYSFFYNRITNFQNAPNILLFTKKALHKNPVTEQFKN